MRRIIAAITIAFAIALLASPATASVESKANKIMTEVFGPCFKQIYSGNLSKTSVVKTSTEVKGVVTVEVYLTRISDGKDTTYQFRVNTGTKYKGIPNPGSGIPTNTAARALVAACP